MVSQFRACAISDCRRNVAQHPTEHCRLRTSASLTELPGGACETIGDMCKHTKTTGGMFSPERQFTAAMRNHAPSLAWSDAPRNIRSAQISSGEGASQHPPGSPMSQSHDRHLAPCHRQSRRSLRAYVNNPEVTLAGYHKLSWLCRSVQLGNGWILRDSGLVG
jgi:hypothetical protein